MSARKWKNFSGFALAAASVPLASVSLVGLPVRAAERVVLTYPPLPPQTVPVKALDAYAQSGTLSPELAPLINLLPPEQSKELRTLLGQRLSISPTLVTQFTTTATGQRFFQGLGEILKTPANQNGAAGLTIAAQRAAAQPEGLTLVNLLRQFPEPTVVLDGQQAMPAITEAANTIRNQNQVLVAIQQQTQQQLQTASTVASLGTLGQVDLRRPGNFTWQRQTLTYTNPSRLPDSRSVTADIYLPQGLSAPAPVVVISHGLGSNRNTFAYLAAHLATHGFVVAVPEHPGSASSRVEQILSGQTNDEVALNRSEILNRPLDIRYLLDELERRAIADPTGFPANVQQVGVMGHSLGGYTALATAGASINFEQLRQVCSSLDTRVLSLNLSLPLQCSIAGISPALKQLTTNFRDPRVKSVIAINPVSSLFFGQTGMAQIQVPTLVIAGSADLFAPPLEEQITPFTGLSTPNKYLLVLEGGTHFSFLGNDNPGAVAISSELVGPNPDLVRPLLAATSLAFLNAYTSNQPQYLPFLSQRYTQAITPRPFRPDLLTSFTPAQLEQALNVSGSPVSVNRQGNGQPEQQQSGRTPTLRSPNLQ
jgi:predicted dienelactone hydrolase